MTNDRIICRSCLKASGTMINLFSEIGDMENLTLSDCFNLCTNIKVENDSAMPETICEDCLAELKIAFNFRTKCEKSDYLLRNHLVKDEFKYEVIDNYGQEMIIDIQPMPNEAVKPGNSNENESEELIRLQNEKWVAEEVAVSVDATETDEQMQEMYLDEEELEDDDDPLITFPAKPEPLSLETIISVKVEKASNQSEKTPSSINNKGSIKRQWFECEQCKTGFKLKEMLQRHMQVAHSGKTLHLCNICGKMFSNDTSLKSHMLQHNGERPYRCTKCPKSYFTRNGLLSHQSAHTNIKPEAKYLCSACGKGFTTNQRLRIHTLTHTGEKNYPCEFCDKLFATEFRLRSHRRTHTGERPYKCSECGITFAQGNALKCHKRIHTGEKPYACKYCDKRFSQNTILKTHMTLHTGKTVQCPDCDKKFSRASYLILHRREHTGEKPYACNRCSNRYKQKSHLDRHMDTHLGVKHRCEICGKEYSKQWSLKMHMFVHADKKPFNCAECSLSFTRKDKYKIHLKVHHEKPISMPIIQILRVNNICGDTTSVTQTLPIIKSVITTATSVSRQRKILGAK